MISRYCTLHFRVAPRDCRKPTGFSLVELMISIVVGLVVVAGVISVFASAVKSHTDNLRMTRLNQELRTTMTLMTRELRRAGFWGGTDLVGLYQRASSSFISKNQLAETAASPRMAGLEATTTGRPRPALATLPVP